MNPRFALLFGLSLAFALAQEPHSDHDGGGPGRRGPGPGGRGPMGAPSLRILDTDGDGVISAAEIQQASAAFSKLDVNQDGRITEDEMRPAFGAPPGRGGGPGGPGGGPGAGGGVSPEDTVAMYMRFDRNGDGILQKDEIPERMQGILARADKNQDQVLTREELTQAASSQAARASAQQQSGRGGPGGRPEGGRGGGMTIMRMDPVLRALDADQNGEISAAEWNAAPQVLTRLDKDGDGRLNIEEIRPAFSPQQRRREGGSDH